GRAVPRGPGRERGAWLSGPRPLLRGREGWPGGLPHLDLAEPAALWVRSERPLEELCATPSLAIVGARRPTAAGANFAHGLASGVARAGVSVISGLALGIDAAAHAGALAAEGRTAAVLR